MGSKSSAGIAVYIVFAALCSPSDTTDTLNYISAQPFDSREVALQTRFKHPASRETVAGPWPRFAKKMLA
jgi:hypothetical protein